MPQVQLTGHVGGRDDDDERFFGWIEPWFLGVVRWLEEAAFLPPLIHALFGGFEVIGFWQIGRHVNTPFYKQLVGNKAPIKQISLSPVRTKGDLFRGATSVRQSWLAHSLPEQTSGLRCNGLTRAVLLPKNGVLRQHHQMTSAVEGWGDFQPGSPFLAGLQRPTPFG